VVGHERAKRRRGRYRTRPGSCAREPAGARGQLLGLPYADAAAVCGCPIGTIRSRVARARDALLAGVERDDPHGLSLATQSAASSTLATTVAPAGSRGRATITTGISSAAAASSFAWVISPPLFLVTSASMR